jgi:hypothetical protein
MQNPQVRPHLSFFWSSVSLSHLCPFAEQCLPCLLDCSSLTARTISDLCLVVQGSLGGTWQRVDVCLDTKERKEEEQGKKGRRLDSWVRPSVAYILGSFTYFSPWLMERKYGRGGGEHCTAPWNCLLLNPLSPILLIDKAHLPFPQFNKDQHTV